MIHLKYYFREGCWLCDKAGEMLNGMTLKYGIDILAINIDSSEELYDLYRYDIPVLEFSDGSTMNGNIKKKELVLKLKSYK
ncbi:glutaredoxin family protein [bacterium]|nr:glutaredoxin family protein [bacterium]